VKQCDEETESLEQVIIDIASINIIFAMVLPAVRNIRQSMKQTPHDA
jgi:hypothetical protein